MIDLVNIIQSECLPRRNCLLSVTDSFGETGFLYFKDAQLIEVNHGTVWGQHAFQLIANWQIVNYAISELPMGIKRTLWEPVDKMIEDVLGTGSAEGVRIAFKNLPPMPASTPAIEHAHKVKRETQRLAFSKLYTLPGFIALFLQVDNELQLIKAEAGKLHPDAKWLEKFTAQCQTFGKTLGTGNIKDIFLKTDVFFAWRIPLQKGPIFLFAETNIDLETFELSMREIIAPLV